MEPPEGKPGECRLLKDFVRHLNELRTFRPPVAIESWPDRENRRSKDIDAMAGHLAIEHTSIDVLPEQRTSAARFNRIVGPLASELSTHPYRLRIVMPYGAVTIGQNWSTIRDALRNWIRTEANALHWGSHEVKDACDIPFQFHADKRQSERGRVLFGLLIPNDNTLSQRLRRQIDGKARKLHPYRTCGKSTLLLIESSDIALMNELALRQALKLAFDGILPNGVDEIWYADTSIASDVCFVDLTAGMQAPS